MGREPSERQVAAADQWNQHLRRQDGLPVVTSLDAGLTLLRDLFYERMHADVERVVGKDSMLMPVSELKAFLATKTEIDVFQVAESACAARQFGYTGTDTWYLLWLAGLRLGPAATDAATTQQLARYHPKTPDERRHLLMDTLLKLLPESGKAPLVLFLLVPLAVQLATALAWGDAARARDVRKRQQTCLPAIADCQECRGRVLDNGALCRQCGNPLWKFEWLTVTD